MGVLNKVIVWFLEIVEYHPEALLVFVVILVVIPYMIYKGKKKE